jgi:hypothetical protein
MGLQATAATVYNVYMAVQVPSLLCAVCHRTSASPDSLESLNIVEGSR